MSTVLIYGSGEWEQLGLGDDAPPEIKKPRIIKSLQNNVSIKQIAWGGMHTILLTTQGKIYSWGCNDEGALGREGAENVPELVDSSLSEPMTHVTAGDCHSLAYNTTTNEIYRWGTYRNQMTGPIGDKALVPVRIGEDEFKDFKVKKVVSGAHHTLVLASGRVFGWGDPETGKIGRMLRGRHKNTQSLKIEAIGIKKARDIFCSIDSSFAIAEGKNGKQIVYSWGLNNWGQLGIGSRDNSSTPTQIKEFKDIDIKMISGGAHHAIALTANGDVYSWGKNEDGQLGIGDTYSEFSRKKALERMDIEDEERKAMEEINKMIKEAEEKNDKAELKKHRADAKRSAKKYTKIKDDEESSENVLYFTRPQKIPWLSNVFYIDSGATYNYAIAHPVSSVPKSATQDSNMETSQPNNEEEKITTKLDDVKISSNNTHTSNLNIVYSWGIGNSYVLGTKDEETEYKPYKVDPEMYKGMNPLTVSCGTLHVVVKAEEATPIEKTEGIHKEVEQPKTVEEPKPIEQPKEVEKSSESVPTVTAAPESKIGTKRKIEQMETDDPPVNHKSEEPAIVSPTKNNSADPQLVTEQKDMSQDQPQKPVEEAALETPVKHQENSNIEDKMENIKLTDSDQKPAKRFKLEETEDKDIEMKHS